MITMVEGLADGGIISMVEGIRTFRRLRRQSSICGVVWCGVIEGNLPMQYFFVLEDPMTI